jgi:glycine betaine/proline transport system permease protein
MAALIPQVPTDFPDIGTGLVARANEFLPWLVSHAGGFFSGLSRAILQPLLWIEHILESAPVWLVLLALGIIAFVASRRILFTIGIVATAYLLGALQLWEEAMQTVSIMILAVLIAVLIGLPLGVLSARSNWFKAGLTPVLDVMQTIPSFVYLIPIAMLFGLGKVPAIIATVIYAMPPLIRLTDLGIREVDLRVTEASRSFGATRWQILTSVQFPLALPSILQGLNQTTMAALAMVVIASLIGAHGLGETVLLGLQRNQLGLGLLGGTGIVLLAIIFDRITQAAGRRRQSYRSIRS